MAETAGILALALLVAAVIVGTWLAWTGHLRAPVVFPLGLVAAALLVWLARPLAWRPAWRRVHVATVCAALGIGAVTALNIASSAAHVATDRDPGVYVVGARLLARTGAIHAPGYAGTPFAAFPGISDGSSGFADFGGDGRRVDLIQSPGLSSLLATAQLAAGDRAMFVLVPLIAGLGMAFFAALATRIAGPWFGLLAAAALAASLAEAYIARDAFAEVPTQALCLGALWILLLALRDAHRGRAALSGLALGGAVAVHFPSMTAVAGLVLAATLETAFGSADVAGLRRTRCYGVACATAVPVAAAGLIGLNHWNASYAHAHRPFIRDFVALIAVLLLTWGITLVLRRRQRLPPAGGARRWIGRLAAAGIGVAAVYAVAIRPSVERGRVPPGVYAAMASLQRAAGVAIEPSRSYSEQTMRWLGDYMGPVALVLGLAGLAYACLRAARPEGTELRVVLSLAVIATTVYTLQPAAFPDQPWVMRRFAPEVIPLLLALGVWLLRELWEARVRARTLLRLAVATASALLVAAPLLVLRPVARASAGHRDDAVVQALCDRIGPDAAVLVVGGPPTTRWYPETISAFCGVPAAAADQPDAAALRRLAAAWALRGRRVVLVASGTPALTRWGIPTNTGESLAVINPHATELPIDRPPGRYRPRLFRLSYAAVAPE